jgi:hypothetical protein
MRTALETNSRNCSTDWQFFTGIPPPRPSGPTPGITPGIGQGKAAGVRGVESVWNASSGLVWTDHSEVSIHTGLRKRLFNQLELHSAFC